MLRGGLSLSLSFSLSVSFYVLEGPAKTLAETLVMLPGLAHSHSAGEGRLRKLIVRFLSAYAEGETERPPPNHPYLNDWRGTEREKSPPNLAYLNDRRRERPYLNYRRRQRETTTQPPSHLHLNDTRREGERPPPSHLYLNDRRRQGERSPPSRWVVVSLCLLLSLR